MINLKAPEKLHPQVWVYRNAIENPLEFLEKIKALPEWNQWWVFGQITDALGGSDYTWDKFPSEEEWNEHLDRVANAQDRERYPEITKVIEEYFYAATKPYIEEHGIELDNWMHQNPSVCVYREEGGVTDDMSMHYHTDYQQEKADARGYKFRVTCTMYLNDDYDGGELAFAILEDRDSPETAVKFDYKPTKGDILVFPSTPPFYHGVKRLRKGDRYFIRNFWLEYFPGTPDWLAGEAEHGEDKWAEMERAREDEYRKKQRTIE